MSRLPRGASAVIHMEAMYSGKVLYSLLIFGSGSSRLTG